MLFDMCRTEDGKISVKLFLEVRFLPDKDFVGIIPGRIFLQTIQNPEKAYFHVGYATKLEYSVQISNS